MAWKCEDCRYFQLDPEREDHGDCRRHPPTVFSAKRGITGGAASETHYPVVSWPSVRKSIGAANGLSATQTMSADGKFGTNVFKSATEVESTTVLSGQPR